MNKNKNSKFKQLSLLLMLAAFGVVSLRLQTSKLDGTRSVSAAIYQTRLTNQVIGPYSRPNLSVSKKVPLGLYQVDVEATEFKSLVAFESLLNHKVNYVLLFKSWGGSDSNFPSEIFSYTKNLELTPIITWEPWERDFVSPNAAQPKYSLSSIANGNHDSYIYEWAEQAKLTNQKIIIRFGHEANSTRSQKLWYPWQGEPGNYRDAFQRIVSIFRTVGANNVKFMWNPIFYGDMKNADKFYPGEDFVDIIGLTLINLGDISGLNGEQYSWLDCGFIYDFQFKPVRKFKKPIIISEILTTESGGSKVKWFEQCFKKISQEKNLMAVIIYNSNVENTRWTKEDIDWRVTKSSIKKRISRLIDKYL